MLKRTPVITTGHDGGACFWIQPVRCLSDRCFSHDSVQECCEEEISIDEEDFADFLSYFIMKHFDTELVYNQQRKADFSDTQCIRPEFEWYLEHNFYTYEVMNYILDEIEGFTSLGEKGMDYLPGGIIRALDHWINDECGKHSISEDQRKQIASECKATLVSFYQEFISRIREIMKRKPDWPLISFMGP